MTVRPTSVIVCTHNRADLLPALIAQIRSQDYPADAFEIVVVDNCSTDQTAQVVEGFLAEPGAAVRYVSEPQRGITYARNRGAEMARFPYLAYVDDDCRIGTDWLWQLVQGFDLHEDVVAEGGRAAGTGGRRQPGYMAFPREHWTRIYSTNPLERLSKEVKGRTNVVGVFPDEASAVRLVGAVLLEIADEWQVGRRYFSLESMAKLAEPEPLLIDEPTPFHLAPVH